MIMPYGRTYGLKQALQNVIKNCIRNEEDLPEIIGLSNMLIKWLSLCNMLFGHIIRFQIKLLIISFPEMSGRCASLSLLLTKPATPVAVACRTTLIFVASEGRNHTEHSISIVISPMSVGSIGRKKGKSKWDYKRMKTLIFDPQPGVSIGFAMKNESCRKLFLSKPGNTEQVVFWVASGCEFSMFVRVTNGSVSNARLVADGSPQILDKHKLKVLVTGAGHTLAAFPGSSVSHKQLRGFLGPFIQRTKRDRDCSVEDMPPSRKRRMLAAVPIGYSPPPPNGDLLWSLSPQKLRLPHDDEKEEVVE